jgi:hypothetical protein
MSSPSSVSVPVLSKQQTLILPATLTRLGEMQKILCLRSLASAKPVPMERAAGRPGGTTIVTRSTARRAMVCQGSCLMSQVMVLRELFV